MREILFRGKRKDNGEWIEGSLILTTAVCQKAYIVDSCWCEHGKVTEEGFADFNWLNAFEVFPETVGQYTGLTDKNGKKVFEGDIVLYERDEEYGQIAYHENEAMFVVQFDTWLTNFDHMYGKDLEVIGNIHDNPELLKGGVEE